MSRDDWRKIHWRELHQIVIFNKTHANADTDTTTAVAAAVDQTMEKSTKINHDNDLPVEIKNEVMSDDGIDTMYDNLCKFIGEQETVKPEPVDGPESGDDANLEPASSSVLNTNATSVKLELYPLSGEKTDDDIDLPLSNNLKSSTTEHVASGRSEPHSITCVESAPMNAVADDHPTTDNGRPNNIDQLA